MNKVLFVGQKGSSLLLLLRILKEGEDRFFEAKESQEFPGVVFYSADELPDDTYLLDCTAEVLKHMGSGLYRSAVLDAPELPLELKPLTNDQHNSYGSSANQPLQTKTGRESHS